MVVWTDTSSGAMAARLLTDRGGHQVGHGLGSLAMAPGGTLRVGGNLKGPQSGR